MDLFTLGVSVIAQERLRVFPARQRAHFANTRLVDDIQERSTTAIAVDRALSVCGLDLAAVHLDFAVFADEGLREVQRVVVVFGVPQADGDLVRCCAFADLVHFCRVAAERVLHVLAYHVEVDGALPVEYGVRLQALQALVWVRGGTYHIQPG